MEDSKLLMQWAMDTLHHGQQVATIDEDCGETTLRSLQALREASEAAEMVQELIAEAHPRNSWSACDGDSTDGSNVGNSSLPPMAMDHDIWPASPNSATRQVRLPSRSGNGGTNPPMSWDFSAAAAQLAGSEGLPAEIAATCGLPELVNGSPPARKAGLKTSGSMAAPYAQDHIIAERKRREKINQRFVELSAVIPGLKKMDKATILSDATRYVKELQEKVKELEACGGSNGRSIDTVLLVKRPFLHAAAAPDGVASQLSSSSGTPAASKQLPEIEARFSEMSVMMRIHCENGKAVVVNVFAEIEELHLGIIHASVMPFSACTLIITITAKVQEGFTVTAEDIVGRLNSVLLPVPSSCNSS